MRWWRIATHPAVLRAGGLWALLGRVRLALALLTDDRVPVATKLVLPAALLYLLSPVDVLPDLFPLLGQVDDLGIVILALLAFIRLCPRAVVAEHEARLRGAGRSPGAGRRAGEPIDAAYRWVDERPGR